MSPKSLFTYRLPPSQSHSLFLFIFLYVSISSLTLFGEGHKGYPLECPSVWILLLYPYCHSTHFSFPWFPPILVLSATFLKNQFWFNFFSIMCHRKCVFPSESAHTYIQTCMIFSWYNQFYFLSSRFLRKILW